MFIISISVQDNVPIDQQQPLFERHVKWFEKYFQTGLFLIVGPYTDVDKSGVIIADVATRVDLMKVLEEDSYYPNLAHYDVREFLPKMIATHIG